VERSGCGGCGRGGGGASDAGQLFTRIPPLVRVPDLTDGMRLELAESELGRLALRFELEPVLATAGADYARHWRGYIASLCGSQSPCSAPAPTAAERRARCEW
jgi:hypothetical protein